LIRKDDFFLIINPVNLPLRVREYITRIKPFTYGISQLPYSEKNEGRCYTVAHEPFFAPDRYSKKDATQRDHKEAKGKIKLSEARFWLTTGFQFKGAVAYRAEEINFVVSFLWDDQRL
jgi:hypothetical protein